MATAKAPYTKPTLRERIKKKVVAGAKGGRPGQWSARKAQLVAAEYKREGGGYRDGVRKAPQRHLQGWTEEKWTTSDGKKAQRGGKMTRYLPKKAWEKLSPAERRATNARKQAGDRKGKQFVANTKAAKQARVRSQSPRSRSRR